MKKYILLAVVAVLLLLGVSMCGTYNGLVESEEGVNAQWTKVESQYQRRADLIPNLVNTVKGYAAHESETLEAVVSARTKATQITVDPADLTEESLKQYQAAQGELSTTLGRLLAITENYPDLKANQNFLELQAQLEGTENRIATERMRYAEVVKNYNAKIRKFPTNIVAGMFGFDKKPHFQASEGSEVAPTVQF